METKNFQLYGILQVPPVDYFKHVILELQNDSGTLLAQTKSTIRALQKRFDEVSCDKVYLKCLTLLHC